MRMVVRRFPSMVASYWLHRNGWSSICLILFGTYLVSGTDSAQLTKSFCSTERSYWCIWDHLRSTTTSFIPLGSYIPSLLTGPGCLSVLLREELWLAATEGRRCEG